MTPLTRARSITLASLLALLTMPSAAGARVLRVGTYHGVAGQFRSIQTAVDAARPGDWILIGPGDYKEHGGRAPVGHGSLASGVLITTRDIYLRGMNRNTVIVDGTRPGSSSCSRRKADQELGPQGSGGSGPLGLNGIMVWKADDVWVQNLTACNYLHGSGDTGNEIWWNGGDGSGRIGGWGFYGSYLNATSTFFSDENTAAQYGIFSSNWSGGTWDETYASNFNDSGYYIGACQRVCDQTVNHAWAEFNALGYSGSNSGGRMLIENSQFDRNQDGFDTNSQNGDNPPPQDGSCPPGVKPPVSGAPTCWVFYRNYSHDNNNPNVPSAGIAGAGPVGTGMSISGGRFDTVIDNRFEHDNAWGVILVPFPDVGPPCNGGTFVGAACWFDEYGDALIGNKFAHNGGYGNPSNGDFAAANLEPNEPTDCFRGNVEEGGGAVTSSPPNAQQTYPLCRGNATMPDSNATFSNQVLCDSQFVPGTPCVDGSYPRRKTVVMHPLPPASQLPTMPDPCAGVPANPWCREAARGP